MADATSAELNNLARKFGSQLIDSGIKMVKGAYRNFKPTVVPFSFLQTALVNVGITSPIVQLDEKYYVTEWSQWEIIKDTTIIDKLVYIAETFDCDNFSYLFSSLAALLFGLNTCGATYGAVYNPQTGALIGYHYFSTIVVSDGKVYVYEPMNDNWALVEKNKPIVLAHGWEYRLLKIYFY